MRAHYSRGTPPIYVLRAREVGGKKFISHKSNIEGDKSADHIREEIMREIGIRSISSLSFFIVLVAVIEETFRVDVGFGQPRS